MIIPYNTCLKNNCDIYINDLDFFLKPGLYPCNNINCLQLVSKGTWLIVLILKTELGILNVVKGMLTNIL